MVVRTNIQAFGSNRFLGITTKSQAKSTEKLSSGYRINRSADDAAGLSISEKMRRQIRGLTQASNNAQDGISFTQIADGALDEVQDMLKRSTSLTIQAANGLYSDTDRKYIQAEIDQLMKEIDRISTATVFNEINVFSEEGLNPNEVSDITQTSELAGGNVITVEWDFIGSDGTKVDASGSQAVGDPTSYGASDMAAFVQKAAKNAIDKIQAAYPNLISRASSSNIKIGLNLENIDGAGETLAQAGLRMSSDGSSSIFSYQLTIDTSDYGIGTFSSMSDDQKADLAATIAHEMTHLVMYDTLTDGMLKGRTTSYPLWFAEGMAQGSSGDNGWANDIKNTTNEATIKTYMQQIKTMPYGAGYLATMYLGQAVYEKNHVGATVNSTNIKSGLDTLMTDMANGKSLDQAIRDNTSYSGLAAFENGFKNADASSLQFAKDFILAKGSGAGSLLAGSLNVTEAAAFAPLSLTNAATNYLIETDNTAYANGFGAGYTFPPIGSYGSGAGNAATLSLLVGSETDQTIDLNRYNIRSSVLFDGNTMDVTTVENAANTIKYIKTASTNVSSIRSYYGAIQNRLEHTIKNLDNIVENTTDAESKIRDTDMATEMVRFSNNNILLQAGQAMLAQANQSQQGVLALLG